MSVDKFESNGASVDDELDDLQKLMAQIMAERPEVRDASEDISAFQDVMDKLIEMRRNAKLSQKDVAKRMGVKQPTVSQFETESSDPRISTLQRYARAVGTHLVIGIADPTVTWTMKTVPTSSGLVDCMWSSTQIFAMRPSLPEAHGAVVSRMEYHGALCSELPPGLARDLEIIAADNHSRADLALGA